ncbi:MAG: hypothetical protein OHK0022_00290 [Roseiflexaceae bacterium]
MPVEGIIRDIVLAAPDETVAEVLARLPSEPNTRRYRYVVAPVGDGTYLASWWREFEVAQEGSEYDLRDVPLIQVAKRFGFVPVTSIPVSANNQAAQELLDKQPSERLVVLDQGEVIGVVDIRRRGGAQLEVLADPFAGPPTKPPLPRERPPMTTTDPGAGDGPEDGSNSDATLTEKSPGALPGDSRVFNAWIENNNGETPLRVGTEYQLAFNVAEPLASAVSASAAEATRLIQEGNLDQLEIDVVLISNESDFTIKKPQQKLVIPRTGASKTVSFTITPQRNGSCEITALFQLAGRALQKMTLTLHVGPLLQAKSSGLTLNSAALAASGLKMSPVVLTILRRDAGYLFLLNSNGVTRYMLNLSETQVNEIVTTARAALLEIVRTPALDGGLPSYQRPETSIPENIHSASLVKLAYHGFLLYQKLFYGSGSGDGERLGDLLRTYSREQPLWIEIVPERFVFPWQLLYDCDEFDPKKIELDNFWGFKHVIQYTPEFSAGRLVNLDPAIRVPDNLDLVFVANAAIDQELASKGLDKPVVQPQMDYLLNQLPQVRVRQLLNTQDLVSLMNNADDPAQLIYLYCHAVSRLPGEPGGVGASRLRLTDKAITLDELSVFAPTSKPPLKSAPLVFLNACESAELSPYLYDGLVPYLINKGARGVLGTEVETPAYFAAEFARIFLERFTKGGVTLGELLLTMRREYAEQRRNVMGLLYALYSSGSVVVERG